ncbi:unnamed protein product [Ilex paraguariensis]|uniref:Protein kinase domain-containing protein n=1 Tax=Ilex paraguariensis TaxID=185542 RepID=A0ABC8SYY0_9AQUA
MSLNHEKKIGLNSNQNHQIRYEGLTRILGLNRMDSECGSDITEFASARGSSEEIENGAHINKECECGKEDGPCGDELWKAFGEMKCDQAAMEAGSLHIEQSESSLCRQPIGLGLSDGSQSVKIKFLCSFGGKILPRPSDGKLRYVGGDTRIISVQKNLSWEELMRKASGICRQPHTIKYQLPGEDLDALISVSSHEDLQNMIEEYHGLEKLGGSQRLRIFLIPMNESENTCNIDASTIQQSNPGYNYVVAVNSIVDPSPHKNYDDQCLASEVSHLKMNLTHNPSFHTNSPSSLLPLEIRDGCGVSHPTWFMNESQSLIMSPTHSPPPPVLAYQESVNSGHTQLCKENTFCGCNDSTSLFSTAPLPPEISNSDITGYGCPSFEALTNKMSFPHEQDDMSQPTKSSVVHSHNHNPSRDFVASPIFDRIDSNSDKCSFERPLLKERTNYSVNPISHLDNPVSPWSVSNESIGSRCGMPHAFSDSQLQEQGRRSAFSDSHKQEQGGRSAYCSQEGMSPSSPLNFAAPPLSSLVVSAALQEKPVQLHENIDVVNPQFQIKLLNGEPTFSPSRADLLNFPLASESLSKVELTPGQNKDSHNGKNHYYGEMMNDFDAKDPLLRQGGKLCDSRSANTTTEDMNKSPNLRRDPICFLGVDTPTQDWQASCHMVPTSSAMHLNPFADTLMEQFQEIQKEKGPAKYIVKVQKTVNDQQHVLTGMMGGEQRSDISWAKNTKVAVTIQSSKQHTYHDSSELSDCLVSHVSPPQVPVAYETDMSLQEPMLMISEELHRDAVHNEAGQHMNLHKTTLAPIPPKDGCFRWEISLLDDDFVNYSDQKVEKSSIGGCSTEEQKLKDIPIRKHNEQNPQNFVGYVEDLNNNISPGIKSSIATVPHIVHAIGSNNKSLTAMEAGRIILESDSEDAKADDAGEDEFISDAMMAELEADIYGLQIIKNADLEEMCELGSGTYGTVYHGKWRGTDVAIKRIKKSCFAGRPSEQERLTKDFWREAQILSHLHHPNVVAFYGVVPDGAGGTLATVTEFMTNGSLRHVLLKKDRSLDRHRKLIIAMDAAFGMEYLHSKNIVHFDLKCDNLLVSLRDPQRPICKVGDFGLSRIKHNTLVSGGVRGTLPWMAPELLNGNSSRVSEKVDVFSFGIAMWEILTGEEPYANMHCGAIIGGIVKNTLRPPIPERCDTEWRKLMEQCWSSDPEARPSFTEITKRLQSMSAGHCNLVRQMKHNITV